jgi:hypothetical protein
MNRTEKIIYNGKNDIQFKKPYIDADEWRERELPNGKKVPFRYLHGGFEKTNVKFSFCFPEKNQYKGHFFQFLSPFPGPNEELASLEKTGVDDKVAFAVTHGAYFIETNMGSGAMFEINEDVTLVYRSSAAAAEYSRVKAQEIYGEHRVYGYVYGGSGGGYKTMSCIENTNAWDGAVPYIIGSPMAIPNCHTTRVHGMRVLRNAFPKIVDALEPGGSGDMYDGLTKEEALVLEEVTQMGMPPRSWFWYDKMDDGALPVLAPSVVMADPGYFKDFWTVPGYLGADPAGSAARDRFVFQSTVKRVYIPGNSDESTAELGGNGADDAFKKMLYDGSEFGIELEQAPRGEDLYLKGVNIIFESGEAKGHKLLLGDLTENKIVLGMCYGMENLDDILSKVRPGDQVLLDNSDYIAMQTYHRHQVPEERQYIAWNQYRDVDGNPNIPQRINVLSQSIAISGAGSLQDGNIQGKVIVVASVMDESAFPWQADWYRKKVQEVNGNNIDDKFRLWYVDHSLHDDKEATVDELHVTSYMGLLRQALLDLSDWVEKGMEPNETTRYSIENGQVILPETARERKGLQPVVTLTVNGMCCVHTKVGEAVNFEAIVELPEQAGKTTAVEWSFEEEQDFPIKGTFEFTKDGGAISKETYSFKEPGTYFVVVRVKANRNGDDKDIFTQMKNICRMRVVVES